MSETIISVSNIFSQLFIGIAVLYSGHRIAKAQYTKSIQDSWSDWNKIALEDEEVRSISLEMLGRQGNGSKEDKRLYAIFSLLNILQASYIGSLNGLLSKSYYAETIKDILKPLMADHKISELVQARGYHPKFKKLCASLSPTA